MLALTLETPIIPQDCEQACLVYRVCEKYLQGSDIVLKAANVFNTIVEHGPSNGSEFEFSVPESRCICMALATIVRYRTEPEEIVVSARSMLEEQLIPGAREVHERLFRNTVDRLSSTGELPPQEALPLRTRAMIQGLTFYAATSDEELKRMLERTEEPTGFISRVA